MQLAAPKEFRSAETKFTTMQPSGLARGERGASTGAGSGGGEGGLALFSLRSSLGSAGAAAAAAFGWGCVLVAAATSEQNELCGLFPGTKRKLIQWSGEPGTVGGGAGEAGGGSVGWQWLRVACGANCQSNLPAKAAGQCCKLQSQLQLVVQLSKKS